MTALRHRRTPLRLLVVLTLAASLLTAAPQTSEGHALCGRMDETSTTIGRLLQAVNVFDVVADTSTATCPDLFDDVQPKQHRDWAGRDANGVTEADLAAAGLDTAQRGRATAARCRDGMAADFPCEKINLLSHVSLAELGGNGVHEVTFINDMWGWTDRRTRKDYAIVGTSTGTAFVDISRPFRPRVKGFLPTGSTEGGDIWRDIKVHRSFVFIGSEHDNHGIQVMWLGKLRGKRGYTTFKESARYTGVGSTHNLHVHRATSTLIAMGSSPDQSINGCGYGLHLIDISRPRHPSFAGCFDADGYIHDTQCVIYRGPDRDHRGRELCFNAAPEVGEATPGVRDSMSITDITDRANPTRVADEVYDGGPFGYSHQGWLTRNQATFLHGDELDEYVAGIPTTTRVWDVSDLDNPVELDSFVNETAAVDHNMYTKGRYLYQTNYTAGLRVLDVSDPANVHEVAHFDVYPENDNGTFEGGAWSNYPYFHKTNVVGVSSIDRGLFVVRVRTWHIPRGR